MGTTNQNKHLRQFNKTAAANRQRSQEIEASSKQAGKRYEIKKEDFKFLSPRQQQEYLQLNTKLFAAKKNTDDLAHLRIKENASQAIDVMKSYGSSKQTPVAVNSKD